MDEFRVLLQSRLQGRGALARLAAASGIGAPVLGRWQRGETKPSPANLKKLAPALGVPYEDLMRMCGYLPGEPRGAELDPDLVTVAAAWPRLSEGLRHAIKTLASAASRNDPVIPAYTIAA